LSLGLIVFLICFFFNLIIGFPIAFNLIFSSIIYLILGGYPISIVVQRIFCASSLISLLTIPFFVLMGQILLRGGVLKLLVDFVNAFVGHIKGALAVVAVLTCLFMGAIVGLAVAEAASLGSLLIPIMKKEGYSPAFSAAVMTAASLLGPIMPPSVLMIIYAVAVGRTSVAGLFAAAVVPALLITFVQIFVILRRSKIENYPSYSKADWPHKLDAFKKAIPILLLPVFLLGFIFGKVCSVNEAAFLGSLYALVITFKKLQMKDYIEILKETAVTSGLIILLVAAGTVASWIIVNERVVYMLTNSLTQLPAWLFLLLLNVFLLINGMFMDDGASAIVWGPIIAPIAWALGIDPLQIGAIVCINLVIGLSTPPFGIVLFVTGPIAGVRIEDIFVEELPLIGVTIGVLLLVTYIPSLTLFLPRLLGY